MSRSRDQPPPGPSLRELLQIPASVVGEAGSDLFGLPWQGDPGLNAVDVFAVGARLLEAFRMGDTPTRNHPVHFAGLDLDLRPDTVAVHDLAGEQIGHRGQTDVWVRADVDGLRDPGGEVHRPQVVEESERAHHAVLGEGQDAADFKPAQVAAALIDDQLRHSLLTLTLQSGLLPLPPRILHRDRPRE